MRTVSETDVGEQNAFQGNQYGEEELSEGLEKRAGKGSSHKLCLIVLVERWDHGKQIRGGMERIFLPIVSRHPINGLRPTTNNPLCPGVLGLNTTLGSAEKDTWHIENIYTIKT